jgi:hypothetical protein
MKLPLLSNKHEGRSFLLNHYAVAQTGENTVMFERASGNHRMTPDANGTGARCSSGLQRVGQESTVVPRKQKSTEMS